MNAALSAYRFYFKILFALAPKAASRKAMQVFGTPVNKKIRHRETEILAHAEEEHLLINGIDIAVYKWGQGRKKALLVHGWEGNGGSLAGMVAPLLQNDYTVWAFDGPAHGKSGGSTTNLFQFAGIVAELLKQKGISDRILAHSFGSASTVQALALHPELHIRKVALLSSPDRLEDVIREFAGVMQFGEKNTQRFLNEITRVFSADPRQINVSTEVRKAHVEAFLVVHDRDDKILAYANSLRVAEAVKDKTEFLTLQNTGHYKMLWSKEVIQAIDQFSKEEIPV